MTKASIPVDRIHHLIDLMGCRFQDGRPESAPALRGEGGVKAFAVENGPVQETEGISVGFPEGGGPVPPRTPNAAALPPHSPARQCGACPKPMPRFTCGSGHCGRDQPRGGNICICSSGGCCCAYSSTSSGQPSDPSSPPDHPPGHPSGHPSGPCGGSSWLAQSSYLQAYN